jgi:hypothetical protein
MGSKINVAKLLEQSLSKHTAAEAEVVEEGAGLAVDLEGATEDEATEAALSGLAVDLESVAAQEEMEDMFELEESTLNNLKAALGAGVATYAVLEARAEQRYAAEAAAE